MRPAFRQPGSPPLASGWRRRWRRLDAWGARHRRPLWWLLMAAVAAFAWLAVPGAGRVFWAWLHDPTGSQRRVIAVPDTLTAEPAPLPTSYNRQPPPAPDAAPPSGQATSVPEFDWRAPDRIRRAAAVLAEHGDLDGALAILLENDHSRAELRGIGQAAYAAVDRLLNQQAPAELAAIRDYWETLPDAERAAFYPPDRSGQAAVFGGLLALPLPATPAEWRQLGEAAPPSLLYLLAHNLYLQTIQAGAGPAALVQLVVSMRLQPPALVLALLSTSPEPPIPLACADHLASFAAALDRHLLPPLFNRLVLAEKQKLLTSQGPLLDWFRTVWGEPFARMADLYPGEQATPEQTRRLVEVLPAATRIFWAQTCLRQLADRDLLLPPGAIAASAWLQPAQLPLHKAAVLQVIRRHPRWLAPLQSCHYDQAIGEIPAILDDLAARGYATTLKVALTDPLLREKRNFEQTIFRWDWLADEARVAQEIPPGLANSVKPRRERVADKVYIFTQWSDVPIPQVQQFMQATMTRVPRQLRPFYTQAFALYALNRGLLRDDAENRQAPPLVPDPLYIPAPPAAQP